MPAAESQAVTDAEAAVTQAKNDLDAFKAIAGNAAHQLILDEIAQSQIALDHATSNSAYALHRCITPDQKAHYDAKIAAEQEMWGYDEMTAEDKAIFDKYISDWTAYH